MIFINLDLNSILEHTKEERKEDINHLHDEIENCLTLIEKRDAIVNRAYDTVRTINNRANDKYFYIAGGNEFFTCQAFENNVRVASWKMHRSEFPKDTEIGTALRWENGNFTIDRTLTDKLANQKKEIENAIQNLHHSFKTEGTYYQVEEKEGGYLTLINQDTKIRFRETGFSQEDYQTIKPGMMLKVEQGNYVIAEQGNYVIAEQGNYVTVERENELPKPPMPQTNDYVWKEETLVAQLEKRIKGVPEEPTFAEKAVDALSDSFLEKLEAKGFGDSNTYFVKGKKDGLVNVVQRFGNLVDGWVKVEDTGATIGFGTILRKKDGKFIVDKVLTAESLKKLVK